MSGPCFLHAIHWNRLPHCHLSVSSLQSWRTGDWIIGDAYSPSRWHLAIDYQLIIDNQSYRIEPWSAEWGAIFREHLQATLRWRYYLQDSMPMSLGLCLRLRSAQSEQPIFLKAYITKRPFSPRIRVAFRGGRRRFVGHAFNKIGCQPLVLHALPCSMQHSKIVASLTSVKLIMWSTINGILARTGRH